MKTAPNILAPGLLIAMPQLRDDNFQESVILLVDHSEDGAMGLIVNQQILHPTLLDVAQAQSIRLDPSLTSQAIYQGGPIETGRGFLLHDNPDLSDSIQLMEGLFLALTADPLKELLEHPGKTRFKFIIGYSGWAAGQLDEELSEGLWLPTECTPDRVLTSGGSDFWENTIRDEGISPELLVVAGGIN